MIDVDIGDRKHETAHDIEEPIPDSQDFLVNLIVSTSRSCHCWVEQYGIMANVLTAHSLSQTELILPLSFHQGLVLLMQVLRKAMDLNLEVELELWKARPSCRVMEVWTLSNYNISFMFCQALCCASRQRAITQAVQTFDWYKRQTTLLESHVSYRSREFNKAEIQDYPLSSASISGLNFLYTFNDLRLTSRWASRAKHHRATPQEFIRHGKTFGHLLYTTCGCSIDFSQSINHRVPRQLGSADFITEAR